jgi:hypothetical protein
MKKGGEHPACTSMKNILLVYAACNAFLFSNSDSCRQDEKGGGTPCLHYQSQLFLIAASLYRFSNSNLAQAY